MQILLVELDNVKSYERASIPFTAGVNAIVGHNGAGKSTILEAIGFALFDSIAYKATDFLREGVRTGSIAVTFVSSYDERPYRVERRFGGSHQYVVHDPELQTKLCEGKVDVLAFVRRHTGADPVIDLSRLFGDAIGVAQGTLTTVFQQAPSARKGTFDSLLQVDEYKTAVDKLLEPRNLLVERQRDLAQQAAVLASRLERLPLLEAALAERSTALDQTQRTLAALIERLAFVKTRKAALDTLRAQIDDLNLRQATLVERSNTLASQVAEAQRVWVEAQQARQTVEANLEGYARYAAAQEERHALENQLRQRQDLLAQQAAADVTVALSTAELARLDEALAEVSRAEQTVVALAPAVTQQAAAEQALAEAQHDLRRLAELEQQIALQRTQSVQLEERQRQLTAQAAKAAETQTAYLAVDQQIAALRESLTQQTGDLAKFHAAAEEINKQNAALQEVATTQCPVCEQPLTPAHRTQMMARNETQLQELRRQYAVVQAAGKRVETELKTATDLQKRLAETLRNAPRQVEIDDLRQRIDQAAQTLAASVALQQTLSTATQRVDALSATLKALDNPRQHSAVAAQQAAQRAALDAKKSQTVERRLEAQQQLSTVNRELTVFAALDAAVAAANTALVIYQAAYQTVLRFRQLGDSLEARRIAEEREQVALVKTQAERAEVERVADAVRSQLDPTEYSSISSEDQTLRGEQGMLQARNELLRQEQHRDEAESVMLRDQQAELDVVQTQQRKLSTQLSVLDTVRTLLRQSGPYITQAVIRQISASAAQMYGELMQDFSRQLRWNEEYGITLESDGVARKFIQLSGGEQMSAALAVRLALVREMSNIDIAFFDEPTANLDDVRREALARQIMNVKGFRQLFVISHDDTFEQATQNLVRVRRHGSTSIIADAG